MRRGPLTAATLALSFAACGCGAGSTDVGSSGPQLTVSAASSLRGALTRYGQHLSGARARFSFGGSDQLAAQIEQGARPDVFASANTQFPKMLHAAGLVGPPRLFAVNRLVLAVPNGSTKVRSLADLARPGVTLAIGSPSAPIGAYTRTVLARVAADERRAILAQVGSQEPSVNGIVGKLTQGAANAGFVYATDVEATRGGLLAIELPASTQPVVAYAAAVVTGTPHAREAQAFVDGLVSGAGQRELRAAGFGPPPA